jgi:disulfide oxidoreductase YuzD
MTATLKYNLREITDLSFSGFDFTIPLETIKTINKICLQVGSSEIASNVYKKTAKDKDNYDNSSNSSSALGSFKPNNKKRKGNKSMEVSAEEWESLRTFQATKIEQKAGIDGDLDQIRLFLNKLTDKTFLDMREKVIERLNKICIDASEEDLVKVGRMIYDLSSTNKFYSKIFADLFSELLLLYKWLNPIFNEKYSNIMEQYVNIEYIDPEKDYDKFCDMNKINEKRKAVTTFFVNLAINGSIPKDGIINLLKDLLTMVTTMVNASDNKNEVDELTENIAILFNKSIIDSATYKRDEYLINGKSIVETITAFAKCKAKDYVSLSNKAIFKFMDLVEM